MASTLFPYRNSQEIVKIKESVQHFIIIFCHGFFFENQIFLLYLRTWCWEELQDREINCRCVVK